MKHVPFILFTLTAVLCSCGTPANEMETMPEAAEGNWQPMFNGRDLTGWTPKFAGRPVGENYLNTFVWEDDMLRVKYDEYENFDANYGHLYFDQPYGRYKMRFEYRFTGEQMPGGIHWNVRNSGVMYHSQSAESNEPGQGFPVSLELQLLGGLSDGKTRTTGNVCTPGTTVVMGDTLNNAHCISSSSPTFDGDRWVRAEAVVLGGEAMHFLIEGDTVLSFRQPQLGGWDASGKQFDDWGFARDKEKWMARNHEVLTTGYIALQAESHPIDFRKVELMVLE